MEDKSSSSEDTAESITFVDKPATDLIDRDSTSMVQRDDGLDFAAVQGSDGGRISEANVVEPDDVMVFQVIPDSSTGLGSSSNEMLSPPKGVVYEFPKDPDEPSVTAAGAELFDPPTAAGERNLTAQGSNEKSAVEDRLTAIESSEVLQAGKVAVTQSTMGSDENERRRQGPDHNPRKRSNQAVADGPDDPKPDREPLVSTSSSDELLDAGATTKRRKLTLVGTVRKEELSDEGNLADAEDSSASSGTETEDRQTNVPIAAGLFGPGGVFGVPKECRPPPTTIPGCDKVGNEQNGGSKLFKEPKPVRKPKYFAASGVTTDLFTIKEEVAEESSAGEKDEAVFKDTQPVQSTKPAYAFKVPQGSLSTTNKIASSVNRTGSQKISGVGSTPAVKSAPGPPSTASASSTGSKGTAGIRRTPAPRATAEPGPSGAASTSRSQSPKIKAKVGTGRHRCGECNARLGLTAIQCRCGNHYCAKHRYDKDHNCTFDYRAMGAEEIRRNNPTVVAEKIRKL